jgi:hypothetical protein
MGYGESHESVKQYTKLLQVLTKHEEGDMQPAKISDSHKKEEL